MRGIVAKFSFIGLTLTVAVWICAIAVDLAHDGQPPITCGFAYGESWLVNIVVDARGRAVFQYFFTNLSQRRGAYCQLAYSGALDSYSFSPFSPWKLTTTARSSIGVHLGLPLFASAVLSFSLWFVPFWRRKRRRKLGLCVHCGYNLRGATTETCSECGKPIVAYNRPLAIQ